MTRSRVLFLCTANSCRSQMAEALLKRHANERFEVISAGYEPGELHPFTVQVMEELGVDMRGHYAKSAREFLGQEFDYVIIVCERLEQTCPKCFPGAGVRWSWPFEDPATFRGNAWERLEKFREVRDQIDERIQMMLQVVPA